MPRIDPQVQQAIRDVLGAADGEPVGSEVLLGACRFVLPEGQVDMVLLSTALADMEGKPDGVVYRGTGDSRGWMLI